MEIQVLVVPGCPNHRLAAERLRRALDDAGLMSTSLATRMIADRPEAELSGFTGSPTILIDGRDPFAEPDAEPSLSCRLYRTSDGLAGAPSLEQLRHALEAATDTGGAHEADAPQAAPGPGCTTPAQAPAAVTTASVAKPSRRPRRMHQVVRVLRAVLRATASSSMTT